MKCPALHILSSIFVSLMKSQYGILFCFPPSILFQKLDFEDDEMKNTYSVFYIIYEIC